MGFFDDYFNYEHFIDHVFDGTFLSEPNYFWETYFLEDDEDSF